MTQDMVLMFLLGYTIGTGITALVYRSACRRLERLARDLAIQLSNAWKENERG